MATNPKDFDFTQNQPVTIINPTAEEFEFKVHSKRYIVPAGATYEVPGYIAWAYIDGIARKVANEKGYGAEMNDPDLRQEHYQKYIIGIKEIMQEVKTEEDPDEAIVLGAPAKKESKEDIVEEKPAAGETYVSKFEKAAKDVRSAHKA